MRARVGPVSAAFTGSVRLTDVNPPASYVLVGEGKGGAAGFAKGSAHVALDEQDDGTTRLRYTVDVSVGGRLAQLGSRLIGGAMNQYATSFVRSLSDIVPPEAAPVPAPAAAIPAAETPEIPPGEAPPVAPDRRRVPLRLAAWAGGFIALAVLVWILVRLV